MFVYVITKYMCTLMPYLGADRAWAWAAAACAGLSRVSHRDVFEFRDVASACVSCVWRGPALGGFFTVDPDILSIRRPSGTSARSTLARHPPAVGQSYAARQAA